MCTIVLTTTYRSFLLYLLGVSRIGDLYINGTEGGSVKGAISLAVYHFLEDVSMSEFKIVTRLSH